MVDPFDSCRCSQDRDTGEVVAAPSVSKVKDENNEKKRIISRRARKVLKKLPQLSKNSKKLLSNVYKKDRKMRKDIDSIIFEAFKTLCILGQGRETEGVDPVQKNPQGAVFMKLSSLLVALRRMGFSVTKDDLISYTRLYRNSGKEQQSEILGDYALQLRETVNGSNVDIAWRPGEAAPRKMQENTEITLELFREIFLDCKLRIESSGYIW